MSAGAPAASRFVLPVLLAGCSSLLFLALHMAFLARAHPDALFMDSLRLLGQVEDWEQGRLSFVELWGLGSAHRGFINQLLMLANIHFFSLDVLLANRLTGAVTAILAFSLVYLFNRQFAGTASAATRIARFPVSLLLAGLCFSWAGFELFTLDLGLPLWIKNLCFVLYFIAHARYLAAPGGGGPRMAWSAGCLVLAGALIVFFVGMGWSYAFVGAVLAVHALAMLAGWMAGQPPRRWLLHRVLPAIALLAALALSLAQGQGGGRGGDEDSFARLLDSVPSMLGLSFHALGASWMGIEAVSYHELPLTAAAWLGAVSLVAAGYGVVQRLRRGLYSGTLLPLYLVAYGVLTALSLAAARGDGGPSAVMASRYYMDVVLFAIGTIWLWFEDADARGWKLSGALFAAYCMVLASGLYLTFQREWATAPYRAESFQAMNLALYRGVPDDAAAQLLQSPLPLARRGAALLRERQLALFAVRGGEACSVDAVARGDGWNAPEGDAVWMQRQAGLLVPACGCGLTAELYLPAEFETRTLSVGQAEGPLQELDLLPGQTARLSLPPHGEMSEVRLSLSRATVPARDIAGGSDTRELGVLWRSLSFPCAVPEPVR